MKKRYYVEENTEIKNYGIYEYLIQCKNNYRIFGAINKSNYVFETDVYSHTSTMDIIEEEIGKYNLWFSARDANKLDFGMRKYDETVNVFQLECVLGMLGECKKYSLETGEVVKISVPYIYFKDKENKEFDDVDLMINEIIEHLNELKKEEEKRRGIKNLKIFKMFKKEKSKLK